jgi:hypothetical protein
MRVIACGPESSGTRLMSRIVATSGLKTIHRSVPHGPDWNIGIEPGDKVVAIVREEIATVQSAIEAGHAPHSNAAMRRRKVAIVLIEEQARMVGVRPVWVSYEELMRDTEKVLAEVSEFLGAPVHLPEPLRPSRM